MTDLIRQTGAWCALAFIFIIVGRQVLAAWEEQGNNRKIAALDGEDVVPDRVAARLVGEMTGEPVYMPPQGDKKTNRYADM